MPTLPKAEDITRASPGVTRRPVQSDAGAVEGRALEAFGSHLARSTEELADGIDRRELAAAQSAFARARIQLGTDAESSTDDFSTLEGTYNTGAERALSGAAAGISNERLRNEFLQSARVDLERGEARVASIARRREVDAGVADLNALLEDNRAAALNATGAEERRSLIEATQLAIQGARDSGYVSEVEAGRLGRDWAESYAKGALDMMDPGDRLAAIGNGTYAGYLQPDEAEKIADRTRREIERQNAVARAEVRALLPDHLASMQTTGAGLPGFDARARAVMKPDDYAAFAMRQSAAAEYHSVAQAIQLAPPEEVRDAVSAFRPEPGSEGFADRQRMYTSLVGAAQQAFAQRLDDPAAVAAQDPSVAAYFRENAGQAAYRVRLERQADLGVPASVRKVLTNGEAESLVSEIASVPAAERAEQIEALDGQFGTLFPQVYRELVAQGLDGNTQILATVSDQPVVAQRLATAIDLGRSELVSGLATTDVRDVKDGVRDSLLDFREVFEAGGFTGGASTTMNQLANSAELLALQEFRQTGNAAAAAENAVKGLTSRYEVLSGDRVQAYVPSSLNGQLINISQVEAAAVEALSTEAIESFDPMPFGGSGLDFLDEARTVQAASSSGFWVTNETATGLVLMVPFDGGGALPLINQEGQLYEVGFADAMAHIDVRMEAAFSGTQRSSVTPQELDELLSAGRITELQHRRLMRQVEGE